jgi:plasmid stabilization system protein ParE
MNTLRWSRVASRHLQQIAEFIRSHSPAQEVRTVDELIARADQLRALPRSGQLREQLPEGLEIRTLLVRSRYRLVYSVEEAGMVNILQILDLRSEGQSWQS